MNPEKKYGTNHNIVMRYSGSGFDLHIGPFLYITRAQRDSREDDQGLRNYLSAETITSMSSFNDDSFSKSNLRIMRLIHLLGI